MTEFKFTGLNSSGQKISGQREASTADDLAIALDLENIVALEIDEVKKTQLNIFSLSFKKKVRSSDLQLFCRQLYTLLKAGIPIAIAIQRLAETCNNVKFSETLQEIMKILNQGYSLVHAFSKFPKIFPALLINIVQIGEDTGQLDEVFLKLSDYLTLEIETKKKIKSAFRYPIMVVSTTLIALLIINAFVIPSFTKIFARLKDIPLTTKILMACSNFLLNYWPFILVFCVIVAFAFKIYINMPEGRRNWHRIILKIPLTGSIVYRMYLSRFCRLYSLMLRAGVSAVDGIILVGKATGNTYIAHKISGIGESLARGTSISNACHQTKLFSPLVVQMLMLGEETGRMDQMLDDVSDFYDREVDYDLSRLSEMIEPILMIIMALMVLVLALGVFLPMWDMAGHG